MATRVKLAVAKQGPPESVLGFMRDVGYRMVRGKDEKRLLEAELEQVSLDEGDDGRVHAHYAVMHYRGGLPSQVEIQLNPERVDLNDRKMATMCSTMMRSAVEDVAANYSRITDARPQQNL